MVLNPTQGCLLFFIFLFKTCPSQQKICAFRHGTNRRHLVLASQNTGHYNTQRVYAPLTRESSVAGMRAVGGLCLEVSLGTWEPDLFIYQLFAEQNRR